MGVKRRLVTIGAGVLMTAAGAIAAAPIASAVTYTPVPGGGVVHRNPGEARAIHDARVGGAVDALLPQYGRNQSGRTLGQGVRTTRRRIMVPTSADSCDGGWDRQSHICT